MWLVSGVLHAAAKEVVVDMAKRPAALDHANRMDWVERVTSFCTEQWGLPPITGRILGWLMICDPAEQSAGQIAEAIGASRASLTANIRQLTAAGFVRRRSRPGERTTYFWIDDDAWERVLHNRFASMAAFKNIARDGKDSPDQDPYKPRECSPLMTPSTGWPALLTPVPNPPNRNGATRESSRN